MDQAAFAHQTFFGQQRERRADANLVRRDHLMWRWTRICGVDGDKRRGSLNHD